MNRGTTGTVVLLALVTALILRPWEDDPDEGPAAAAATVVRVVDGDTFEAEVEGLGRERVRMIGVDTPETVKPGAAVECFGPRASAFAKRALSGRRVRLTMGEERRDRYGRLLAYAELGDRMVNAELLRRGLARTLTIPPNDRYAARFRALELAAARAGRGLWGACPP